MAGSVVRSRNARKRYLVVAVLLGFAVFTGGWLFDAYLTSPAVMPLAPGSAVTGDSEEFASVFAAAVRQMQLRQYRQALSLWHRALLIDAEIPEVRVNMGFTLFELGEYATAREFFIAAMEQNAYQANAYYGLALVSEKMGDLEGALGAMRSYIHLAAGEQHADFVRRARAALWEWEAQLDTKKKDSGSAE